MHSEQDNGTHLFTWPVDGKIKLPMIDTRADVGKFVRGILTGPTAFARPAYNTIVAVTQMLSFEDQLTAWGEVNGVPIKFIKAEVEWWSKQLLELRGISEDFLAVWVPFFSFFENCSTDFWRRYADMFAGFNDFGYTGNDAAIDLVAEQKYALLSKPGDKLSSVKEYYERVKREGHGEWSFSY
jgi:hypothetical protein